MTLDINRRALRTLLLVVGVSLLFCIAADAQSDPLPSWNDGANKRAIIEYVNRVTKEGGADFVPVNERIATFDNDGTLWSEQPIYFQFAFALDCVKAFATRHPEWKTQQPYKAVFEGDLNALAASGEKGVWQRFVCFSPLRSKRPANGDLVGVRNHCPFRPLTLRCFF